MKSRRQILIFISHIHEESNVANIVKKYLEKSFLSVVNFFVATDSKSISPGDKWLEEISMAIKDAEIMLVICSRESVSRPWINFEIGAFWASGKPLAPLCHSNLKKSDLPNPLNQFQAINLTEQSDLESLVKLIAKKLGSDVPNIDYSKMIEEISTLDQKIIEEKKIIPLISESQVARIPVPLHYAKKRVEQSLRDYANFSKIIVIDIPQAISIVRKILVSFRPEFEPLSQKLIEEGIKELVKEGKLSRKDEDLDLSNLL